MARKIISLTESELIEHIRKVVNEAMNGIDGKTLAQVPNAVKKDKAKGKGTEQRANASLLNPFTHITFLFYATTRLGRTTFLTFKVQDIKKHIMGTAILSGEVMYDGDMMIGDIHIDFNSGRVFYKEKKSRYTYTLEPDNRTKQQWDALLEQLKMLNTAEGQLACNYHNDEFCERLETLKTSLINRHKMQTETMDKMLEKLMEQEARLVKEQQSQEHEGEVKLSPKIDIEECLRNGYITAEDYEKTHQQ